MVKSVFSCLLTAVMASGFAIGPEATIIKVHRDFETATVKNDMKAAARIVRANFSKDFVMKNPDGSQDLEQFIEDLVPPGKVTTFHFVLGKITTKGDTATLKVTVEFKATVAHGRGKPTPISAQEVDTETWKLIKGSWKMTSVEQVTVHEKK